MSDLIRFPNPFSFGLVGLILAHGLGGSSPVQASEPIAPDPHQILLAQNPDPAGACYVSAQQIGVYREPNPLSEALGILPPGAIVWVAASGQGWVRLQAPIVGWMAAQSLQVNPFGGCNGLGSVIPLTDTVPPANLNTDLATPENTSNAASANISNDETPLFPVRDPQIQILCEVIASDGLGVRNQPLLHPRTLIAILEPGQHRLQFSDRQVRLQTPTQTRDWFYITAPVEGWISPRIVGSPRVDLRGEGCL